MIIWIGVVVVIVVAVLIVAFVVLNAMYNGH